MKLNTKRTVLVGLAFLSISAFWQLYEGVVPLILKNSFDVGDTVSGVIMAMDNVLALFMLPLFGALSDRCRSRLGRRMPFILGGTAGAVVSMVLMPLADNGRILPLFIGALAGALLAMGTYRSPAVALMPDLTPKPLRSRANAVINLMGAAGGMYSLLMIRLLVGKGITPSYLPVFLAVAALMLAAVAVLALTVRERRLEKDMSARGELEEEKPGIPGEKIPLDPAMRRSLLLILCSVAFWFMGYNAVTTAFSKYAQVRWGMEGGGFASCLMVATVAAILSYLPVGMISSRVGRKKTILFGVALLFACFGVGGLVTRYTPLLNVLFGVVGVAWAAINVNSYPMVVEMSRTGDVGKYTGYYYTFSMAAQVVTPILSGFLLEHVGYWVLFPYAALFVALAFVTMSLVRHGDSRIEGRKS